MLNDNRQVLLRDFGIFMLKLWLDGLKDVAVMFLAMGAASVDFLTGRRHRPSLFYAVLKLSERADLWLNLNGAAEGAEEDVDGLFGRSAAGSPTLVGRLEQLVRGGDGPLRPMGERRAA
ncbi:MAG TPA: hypothetical protein VMK65_09395 [Longimicrobiales bacterium]|nr:hypothetical protein [Longimicrobiales bacterium]